MQKKKIAIIFGGNSTEYEVSLQSAFSVFENINKEKFDISSNRNYQKWRLVSLHRQKRKDCK